MTTTNTTATLRNSRKVNYPKDGIRWQEKLVGGTRLELSSEVKALLLNIPRH